MRWSSAPLYSWPPSRWLAECIRRPPTLSKKRSPSLKRRTRKSRSRAKKCRQRAAVSLKRARDNSVVNLERMIR